MITSYLKTMEMTKKMKQCKMMTIRNDELFENIDDSEDEDFIL